MKTTINYMFAMIVVLGQIVVLPVLTFFILMNKWSEWVSVEAPKYHNKIKSL